MNNEIAAITPINISGKSFSTTITFTASDGIDSKSHTVKIMVIGGEEKIADDAESISNETEDAAGISEHISDSSLDLTADKDNFNATITITASDGNLSAGKEIRKELPSLTGFTPIGDCWIAFSTSRKIKFIPPTATRNFSLLPVTLIKPE